MEWHEVNNPPDDHSFDDRRVSTVLAMKDKRIDELKGYLDELHMQLARRDRFRPVYFVLMGVALVNLLSALWNLGVFDALV